MMNRYFSKITTSLLILTAGLSSCSSDEDVNPLAIKSINVDYAVQVNQNTLDYYDVEVKYCNDKGEVSTFSLTDTEKWSYTFSLPPSQAPKNYAFIVTATPKKEYPAIEPGKYYNIDYDVTCEFYAVRNNGETFKELSSDLAPYSGSDSVRDRYTSDNLSTAMSSGHSRHFADFQKKWDGKLP